MKKATLVIIIAAFAWSIQACNNRTDDNRNNDNLGDSLNHDTMATPPPLDTSNQTLDTMDMNQDTLE